MKKAIEQIKKLRGVQKSSIDFVNSVYFKNGGIYWSDGYFFYKKALNMPELSGFAVNLKMLYDILKNVKAVESVKVENNILIINNQYKIKTESENNITFADIFTDDLFCKKIVTLKTDELKEFIKSAAITEMGGILRNFIVKSGKIAVTDGNRLNIMNYKSDVSHAPDGVMIPAEFISKNLNKTSDIYNSVDNKYITCVSGNELIAHAYIEGHYPKYEQLIPHNEVKVKYNKKEFLQVLKEIKPFLNKRLPLVVFDFNNNKIKIKNDDIIQDFDFDFKISSIEYGAITFNYNYLLDLLNYMDNDFILSYGNSNLNCCVAELGAKMTLLMPVFNKDYSEYNAESEFKKQIAEIPAEVKEVLEDVKAETVASPEYKEIIKTTEAKKPLKTSEHVNLVTGHKYMGNNAELLTQSMQKNNYTSPEWVGKMQATKLKKQVRNGASGVLIKIYYEDDMGRSFCKLETVYNVAELEELQKVEDTNIFKKMINRLKAWA